VRYLLDTVAFLCAAANKLDTGRKAKKIILSPENVLELSAISLIEIHIKAGLNKLDITTPQVRTALADMDVKVLPLTAAHCEEFERLPSHHKDPFDRMIIAQALSEQIPVLSSDAHFPLYHGLKVIW
jgi:PIN domain nuclease of toxin-antitoxin system